jgi:hypothetical protein
VRKEREHWSLEARLIFSQSPIKPLSFAIACPSHSTSSFSPNPIQSQSHFRLMFYFFIPISTSPHCFSLRSGRSPSIAFIHEFLCHILLFFFSFFFLIFRHKLPLGATQLWVHIFGGSCMEKIKTLEFCRPIFN